MLAYYKEKKYLIISLIAIILDGVISYLLPSFFNRIIVYPMFTISLIPFLSKSNNKKNIIFIFIIGFIYNSLYSNIFLFHPLIFIILSKIDNSLLKIFKESIVSYIFLGITNIIIYDSLYYLLIILTAYQVLNINDLLYKIKNSLIINIMSVFVYYNLVKNKKTLHKM